MRSDPPGQRLIAELFDNSKKFFDAGKAYELLQEFFAGLALDTLRPLLASNDQYIRRTAVWIASELGVRGCVLIGDVLRLRNDPDRYVQYHVLEIIAVCARDEKLPAFAHIIRSLESEDEVLRILAMRLISNAEWTHLKLAAELCDISHLTERPHAKGLLDLAASESLVEHDVLKMLEDANPIIRKYGAIAAKRLQQKFPALITRVSESADSDLRKFAAA